MKKLIGGVLIVVVSACKTSSHKCDAYGYMEVEEYDIHKLNAESQKKYSSCFVVK